RAPPDEAGAVRHLGQADMQGVEGCDLVKIVEREAGRRISARCGQPPQFRAGATLGGRLARRSLIGKSRKRRSQRQNACGDAQNCTVRVTHDDSLERELLDPSPRNGLLVALEHAAARLRGPQRLSSSAWPRS